MNESHLPCTAPSMSFLVSTTLAFPFPFPFFFGTGGGEPVVGSRNKGSWSLNQGWSLTSFSFAHWMHSQGGHFQDFWRDSGLTINASAVIRWIGMANPTSKSATTNFTFCYWNIREICKYVPKLTSSSHTPVLFCSNTPDCCVAWGHWCIVLLPLQHVQWHPWHDPHQLGWERMWWHAVETCLKYIECGWMGFDEIKCDGVDKGERYQSWHYIL